MRVGIMTGGGDCPGLNAAIRAAVRKGIKDYRFEFVGIRDGWKGLLEADAIPLDRDIIRGLLVKGGTILGSTPHAVFKGDVSVERLTEGYNRLHLDALIVIGGDETLNVARRLSDASLKVVGIPKTIDNDLLGTERTIGFSTALTVAVEAIDRLHTTAESHHRVMIVEVMGRHAGWIATHAGIAGGADLILIPERPFDIDDICQLIKRRHETKSFTIVVVAEGAVQRGGTEITNADEKDAFGYATLGGVANWLKKEIRSRTGFDTRATILGHVQRGGTPTPEDRILATRFGVAAIRMVHEGWFGVMVALRGDEIVSVPLREAIKDRVVDQDWYALAETFFD
jgi:6-phosphofructokinase 1